MFFRPKFSGILFFTLPPMRLLPRPPNAKRVLALFRKQLLAICKPMAAVVGFARRSHPTKPPTKRRTICPLFSAFPFDSITARERFWFSNSAPPYDSHHRNHRHATQIGR